MKAYFGIMNRADNFVVFFAKSEDHIRIGSDVLVKMTDGIWVAKVIDFPIDHEYIEGAPTFHGNIQGEDQKIINQNYETETEYKEKVMNYFEEGQAPIKIYELEINFNRTRLNIYYQKKGFVDFAKAESDLEDMLKTHISFITDFYSVSCIKMRFTQEYALASTKQRFDKDDRIVVLKDDGLWTGKFLRNNCKKDGTDNFKPDIKILGPIDATIDRILRKIEKDENEAFAVCRKFADSDKLQMNLLRAEYNLSEKKVFFYYTSEGRVDFRNLVKNLAGNLRKRIEMKQIGIRDELKTFPTLGICGQVTCCSRYISKFEPIVLRMAKIQNMDINTEKITGLCNRLLCCLKYEYVNYLEFVEKLNTLPKKFKYQGDDGKSETFEIIGFNPLKGTVLVRNEENFRQSLDFGKLKESIRPNMIVDNSRPVEVGEEMSESLDDKAGEA